MTDLDALASNACKILFKSETTQLPWEQKTVNWRGEALKRAQRKSRKNTEGEYWDIRKCGIPCGEKKVMACSGDRRKREWEHWCVLGTVRTRAERRIFPASGHTLCSLSLCLFLSLIVSHTGSVATGLRIGLTTPPTSRLDEGSAKWK